MASAGCLGLRLFVFCLDPCVLTTAARKEVHPSWKKGFDKSLFRLAKRVKDCFFCKGDFFALFSIGRSFLGGHPFLLKKSLFRKTYIHLAFF